ncbi:MAG TPA: competence/damage-inducible protein A [Acidimicrobiia bacterium]|nr:competence/damage-inducible protein A [Acidimicrobiia bacterium]
MRCEVLAIGTELLLGQIVDTNSTWIGEQLADAGIDSFEHRQVGDNLGRMVQALRELLDRSDAVIVCGGLGPTPDDMTRQAIAEVMGVELERRDDLIEWVSALFTSRGRAMPENNLRQCDVPVGAEPIPNSVGTAPGINAPIADKVVYAVPGVPYEMQLMMSEHVLPDLLARSGQQSAIVSRSLRTWGTSESGLAEMIAHRVDAQTNPTIAFLARGIEGLVVRITAKASTPEEARALIEPEERALREILGDLVFGVDDETMETVVLDLLRKRGLTLGLAESITGGLVASRLVSVPGTSDVLKGGVVAYMTDAKRSVLGVTAESVVSNECARQLAAAARRVFDADVGLGVTGVAGPEEQDGQPAGTVFFGLAVGDEPAEAVGTQLPGQREMVRQFATISLLNLLRMKLVSMG